MDQPAPKIQFFLAWAMRLYYAFFTQHTPSVEESVESNRVYWQRLCFKTTTTWLHS